jgi:hypothetical protein
MAACGAKVYTGKMKEALSYSMINAGLVNARRFLFLPAAKCAIFDDFTPKSALQKVR